MKIRLQGFHGEIPTVADQLLPDNAASRAVNCRMLSGNLEAWQGNRDDFTLPKTGPIDAIRLMAREFWLHWSEDVTSARGPVPADVKERTYYTGTDLPRVTDKVKALAGPGQEFPYESLILGVPAPVNVAAVSQSVSVDSTAFYSNDGSNVSGWTTSPPLAGPPSRNVQTDAGVGNPAPSISLVNVGVTTLFSYLGRDLALNSFAAVIVEFDLRIDAAATGSVHMGYDSTNAGAGRSYRITASATANDGRVRDGTRSANTSAGSYDPSLSAPESNLDIPTGAFRRVRYTFTRNDDGTYQMDVSIKNGATVVFALTYNNVTLTKAWLWFINEDPTNTVYIDNFFVTKAGDFANAVETNYVYTFVNEYGEEGAPTTPSDTILFDENYTTVVSGLDVTAPAGYGVVSKRIYRAATSDSGTQYQFIDEIPLAQDSFTDIKTDAELGEVLATENFDLPPDDLDGIVALSNGVMAGFSKNQICVTPQFHPHAWPVDYRQTTDTDIVGIGAVDTTIVALTEANPYLVIGSDPSAMSMSKMEIPYGCSSKRSIATMKGLGVIYASPDGLVAIGGTGAPIIVTERWFSRKDWQALNPASILGIAHDDRYYAFYDTGTERGGFIFDPKQGGLGLTLLDFHATAAYTDPLTDTLYFVLSDHINSWDKSPVKMPFVWRSKAVQFPLPCALPCAIVRCDDYTDIRVRVYGDGALIANVPITSEREFTMPAKVARSYYFEFAGTSAVQNAEFAEVMDELG